MNNKFGKYLLAAGLASTMMGATAATTDDNTKLNVNDGNPLMNRSTLPYGAPNFGIVKSSDYLPALKAGIEQKREEIRRIVDNPEKPTFKNTILAYENSGQLLGSVSNVFFALTNAHKTPELATAEDEAIPLLTALENEISFN